MCDGEWSVMEKGVMETDNGDGVVKAMMETDIEMGVVEKGMIEGCM